LTLIGGFAGFQFSGSEDPAKPVKIACWGPDQLAYWTDPNDSTRVDAVATLDFRDNRRHLRLWTKDQIVDFDTTKGLTHPGFGSASFERSTRRANPYRDSDGQGILPFSFSHWEFPVGEFTTNSPGLNLRDLNQGVNDRLDNLGDSIYFNCKPIGLAEGVADGWIPPVELRPGDFIKLPSEQDIGGNGPQATLKYLMPDLRYVAADWEDMNAFLDHTLEMYGVPPSLIRMVQSGAKSGLAIQSEQLPILGFVEGRRADWGCYEEEAAKTAVAIGAAHLRNVGLDSDAGRLAAILDDWAFSLRWPSLFIQLPGPERDAADDWRLNHSLVSLVGLLQERQDLTESEAFEALAKVAEQNARLKSLGINPTPGGNPFGSMGGGGADLEPGGLDSGEPAPAAGGGPGPDEESNPDEQAGGPY
jgi:hypothetical protein